MSTKRKAFTSIALKCVVLLALWLLSFCVGWHFKLESLSKELTWKSTNFTVEKRALGSRSGGPIVNSLDGETYIVFSRARRSEIGKHGVLLKHDASVSGNNLHPIAIVEIVDATSVGGLRVVRTFDNEEFDFDRHDQVQLWH